MKSLTLPLFPASIVPPPLDPEPPLTASEKRRKYETPRGYAYPPGTGPAGETCRSCAHSVRSPGNTRNYWKCGLVPRTHGAGTDIRLKTPACAKWQQHRDLHAGDRVLILPAGPRQAYHRTDGRRPRQGIVRGPSSSPDYYEVIIRHGRREKNIYLPITRLRFLRSAK